MKYLNVFFLISILIWGLVCIAMPIHTAAHEAVAPATFPSESNAAKAIRYWRQKANQYPKADQPKRYLGDALMQRAREIGDPHDYGDAKSAFQSALYLNPKNSAAMVGMAWVHGALHEFGASTQWAEKAIVLNPENPDAYGLLGDAAVELGDYDAAFDYYQKMLDIRPDLASYSRGAHLLFVTGDIRPAIELMKKAISAGAPFAENTAWCRAALARMLWSIGVLSQADQVLRVGLEAMPHNVHLLAALGMVKTSMRDRTAAVAAYEKAVDIQPRHEDVIALGHLYTLTNQPEKAEMLLDKAKKLYRTHQAAGIQNNILRARFYADQGIRLASALQEARNVYAEYKNVFVADTLAWCYYRVGRYQHARDIIEKALRYHTPDPMIWYHAGMIYMQLGDMTRAIKHLERALNLNSEFHPVYAAKALKTLNQLAPPAH